MYYIKLQFSKHVKFEFVVDSDWRDQNGLKTAFKCMEIVKTKI